MHRKVWPQNLIARQRMERLDGRLKHGTGRRPQSAADQSALLREHRHRPSIAMGQMQELYRTLLLPAGLPE